MDQNINTSVFKAVWADKTYKRAFIKYALKHIRNDSDGHSIQKIYNSIDGKISKAISQGASDDDIMRMLQTFTRIDNAPRNKDRLRIINEFINPHENPIINYCDIGCGDGKLTAEIGAALGAKNIYGIDIYPIDKQHAPIKIVSGNVFGTLPGGVIYCPHDGINTLQQSFDFITIFMTLHHIEPALIMPILKFAYTSLAPNGMLLIREHDTGGGPSGGHEAPDALDAPAKTRQKILINFLRLIHMHNLDYSYAHYESAAEWIKIISDIGFDLLKVSFYKEPNPQRIFHASFIKRPIGAM